MENPQQQKVSPQEQEIYQRVVLAGTKAIYDKSTHAAIVNMLRSAQPADALSKTAMMIIVQLDKKSGDKIPGDVVLPAASEILVELSKLAAAAGIFKASQAVLSVAMQKMLVLAAQQYGVNKQSVQKVLASVPHDKVQSMVAEQSQYARSAA